MGILRRIDAAMGSFAAVPDAGAVRPAEDDGASFGPSPSSSPSPGGKDALGSVRDSIVWKMLLPIPITCGVAMLAAVLLLPRLMAANAVQDAVDVAHRTVQQFQAVRAYYTRTVAARALAGGLRTTTDPAGNPAAIPAPSTMLHELSDMLAGQGTQVHVYSPYPFPNRAGRVLDPFQQEAWAFLSRNPEEAFARQDVVDGRSVVRVALADRMTEQACVSCHNATAGLAKRDWQLGDVRGVMEVVSDDGARLGRDREVTLLLLGACLGAAGLLSLVSAVLARRISQPIRSLTSVMHRLAAGDTDVVVPAPARRDEVGTIAAAVEVFRRNAVAKLRQDAQVAFMARHDALTGLPNRAGLREHLEHLLGRLRRDGTAAVLLLDLAGFKDVNDAHGRQAGDDLLRQVARRLQSCTREGDLVARLGADEFAVVQAAALPAADPAAAPSVMAERLVEALRAPFDLRGEGAAAGGPGTDATSVSIGACIGLAVADRPGVRAGASAEELLRNAGIALHRAKADGTGTCCLFEPGMDVEIQRRRALEADLRRALAEEQFEVHYQPLVRAGTRALTGFEALVRWRHPARGLVPPGEFIPLTEEMGLIRPLGRWVLARACADAAGWPEEVKVAVNLSPVQFAGGDLVEEVGEALAASGLAAGRLELEITESVLLQDNDATLAVLHRLRAMGVRISMDDFGTGYSSLSYLRRFPFDKIKVDQSFVRNLVRDKGSIEIVRAVVGLGKALGMGVLAEGVETEEQSGTLRDEGCDELQGYLFSKPRPVQDVPGIIAAHRPGRAAPSHGPRLAAGPDGAKAAA